MVKQNKHNKIIQITVSQKYSPKWRYPRYISKDNILVKAWNGNFFFKYAKMKLNPNIQRRLWYKPFNFSEIDPSWWMTSWVGRMSRWERQCVSVARSMKRDTSWSSVISAGTGYMGSVSGYAREFLKMWRVIFTLILDWWVASKWHRQIPLSKVWATLWTFHHEGRN